MNVPVLRLRLPVALMLILALAQLASCGDDDHPTLPGGSGARNARIVRSPGVPTSVSDSLTFMAAVVDSVLPVTQATVEWRSNRDGVLGGGHPLPNGVQEISVPPLSRGVHVISVWVNFGLGLRQYDAVTVQNILPARVVMGSTSIAQEGVTVTWEASNEPAFVRYELRRWVDDQTYADNGLLFTFTDRNVIEAVDALPPLYENVHYAINVVIAGDLEAESRPAATAWRPNGPVLDFQPFDAVRHPTASIVYVLDRSTSVSRLVAIDYLSKELLADRTFDHRLQYLEVADNGLGVELYVSRNDDGISVLNPLTLDEIVHVPLGYPTGSVTTDRQGRVYVSLGTGTFSVDPTRCYDRVTWQELDAAGHYDWVRLEHIPGTTEFIEATMGLSPVSVLHLQYDAGGHLTARTPVERPYGSYAAPDPLRIDPTGTYFVCHGWGSVYEADVTGAHRGNLPVPNGTYNDFAFNADGSLLYVGYSTLKAALVFDATTLLTVDTVTMRGYARRLFNDGTYLIGVSRREINDDKVCVDVIPLPTILSGRSP